MRKRKVYGIDSLTSIDTYIEHSSVKNIDGIGYLEINVAGPIGYRNIIRMDIDSECKIIKDLCSKSIKRLKDLDGHSVVAFYKSKTLIGFMKR